MTDERYGIPTTRLADAQSRHATVWRSRYDGPYTGLPDAFPEELTELVKLPCAAHGSDGYAVWQGGPGLAGQLHDAWGNFAAAGAPATGDRPGWPGYDTTRRATMIFDPAGPHVSDDPRPAERAAWDGLDWQSGAWWRFDGVT